MPNRGQNLTVIQLASLLDVSPRTIREHIASGCPVAEKAKPGKPNLINSVEYFHWHDDRIRAEATGPRASGGADADKRRVTAARAEIVEMELAQKRGETCADRGNYAFAR